MSQTILVGSKPGFLLAIHSQSPLPPNNAVLEDQCCMEFSVPDLYTIAKKDNDHDAQQTIVCMNALNLKVYTHIPEGLKIFSQLSEATGKGHPWCGCWCCDINKEEHIY
jgi:hypothetical protein